MNHANMNANETFLGLLEVQNEMQIACGKWTNFPRNECNSKCAFLRYFAITFQNEYRCVSALNQESGSYLLIL